MQRDDLIRIRHMLDAGEKAVSFAADKKRTDLDDDPMLAFALMKAIEIIGEAASKISPSSQERHREIPWREIVGMRNRLIHAYVEISLDILWHTVTSNLQNGYVRMWISGTITGKQLAISIQVVS